MIRVPVWATKGPNQLQLNGSPLPQTLVPGTYAKISRQWAAGDSLRADFPMDFHVEQLNDNRPDYSQIYAFFYGPVLLAGLTSSATLVGDVKNLDSWLQRTSTADLTFVAHTKYGDVNLIPLYTVMLEAYTVYFNTSGFAVIPYNPDGSVIPSTSAGDFETTGGAGIISNPTTSVRSGNPHETNTVTMRYAIQDATHTIDRLQLQYSYITGYSNGGANGANFSVVLQDFNTGAQIFLYGSPHLTDYEYDRCSTCFSPPVQVRAANINKQPKNPQFVKFIFQDNDRNVQLKLGLSITVYWK
jgi:hypothetical protein